MFATLTSGEVISSKCVSLAVFTESKLADDTRDYLFIETAEGNYHVVGEHAKKDALTLRRIGVIVIWQTPVSGH